MNLKDIFDQQGYISPLQVLSSEELSTFRREFDRLESAGGKDASQVGIMGLHRTNAIVWDMVTHPRVIDAAKQVLGPDVLLLGSHFFVKYPELEESYVAWHQDVTYWKLQPPQAISVWLAIDDADVDNGCLRVIHGSHRQGLLPHGDSKVQGNLLSANQEIPADLVDKSQAVDLPLPAGSASIHDGLTIHGSNPNHSNRRRCGVTIRFTTPDVAPSDGKAQTVWKPILIAGEDRYGNFHLHPKPDFSAAPNDAPAATVSA